MERGCVECEQQGKQEDNAVMSVAQHYASYLISTLASADD
jgi:hypothetical protein